MVPDNVSVPDPALVKLPVPEITPLTEEEPLLVIFKLSFNTIAAALTPVPFNVELADTVVVPEYDCVPEVVTFAPIFDVPYTDKSVTLDIAPSKSKLPVTVKAFDPPVTAASVTVEPSSVLSPAERVVVPEYDCVPEVVTLAAKVDAPVTLKLESPVASLVDN